MKYETRCKRLLLAVEDQCYILNPEWSFTYPWQNLLSEIWMLTTRRKNRPVPSVLLGIVYDALTKEDTPHAEWIDLMDALSDCVDGPLASYEWTVTALGELIYP